MINFIKAKAKQENFFAKLKLFLRNKIFFHFL